MNLGARATGTGWRATLSVVVAVGCGAPAPERPAATEDPDDGVVHAERLVVYMQAPHEEVLAARDDLDDEDFAVVADDLMWYRATAAEFLERHELPVRHVSGRRPLTFLIDGEPRTYTFDDVAGLDLLVAYDPGREPIAIPPVVVEQVLDYFGLELSRSSGPPPDPPGSPGAPGSGSRPR
jgi:hypothetical protein